MACVEPGRRRLILLWILRTVPRPRTPGGRFYPAGRSLALLLHPLGGVQRFCFYEIPCDPPAPFPTTHCSVSDLLPPAVYRLSAVDTTRHRTAATSPCILHR